MSPNAHPKLVVLSAPSGTGKSTLAAMLLAKHPSFSLSISFTTRQPRGNEQSGVHYFFTTEPEFRQMVKNGELLEHALVFGKHWYGTSRQSVEKMLGAGQNVLFDIDVQGAKSLKAAFKERCVTIFLLPPSIEELERRLRNRKTDSPEAIELRLKTAKEELDQAHFFDHQLINSDIDGTYASIEQVLSAKGCI